MTISILLQFGEALNAQFIHNWSFGTGSGSGTDFITGLVFQDNGHIVTLGRFLETCDFDPSPDNVPLTSNGSWDMFLAKYDKEGSIVFAHKFGGISDENEASLSIDRYNNLYICGAFKETVDFDPGNDSHYLVANGDSDIFIAKYDPDGNFIFAFNIGDTLYERARKIVVDSTGNIYIAGRFSGTVDFDPGIGINQLSLQPDHSGAFIAKYDSSGNYLFAKKIGDDDEAFSLYDMALDSNGYIYVVGDFYGTADFDPGIGVHYLTSSGENDCFFAKYDAGGSLVFAYQIGNELEDILSSIVINYNQVYLAGTFSKEVDFDLGNDSFILEASENKDIFIAKYHTNGSFINVIKLNGSENFDFPFGMTSDLEENIYITGIFENEVDFDPGVEFEVLESNGKGDVFLAKYDSLLQYKEAVSFGSEEYDRGRTLAVDPDGNICIGGSFYTQSDFDPGPGESILTSNGYDDIFLAKYSQGMVNTANLPASTTGFKIFPNPASDIVHLDTREAIIDADVLIINLAGQVVSTCKGLSGKHFEADISTLPPGIYILEVAEDGKVFREKVVVER